MPPDNESITTDRGPDKSDQELSEPVLSPEQENEAKRYGRGQLTCQIADKLLDLAYLGLMAFLVAQPLDKWLMLNMGLYGFWPRLIVFFLILFLGHELVSLPLSFYSGHVLEKKYGLSTLSAARWLGRHLARYVIALIFSLFLFVGLYVIIMAFGERWWLIAAAAYFLVSVVVGQLGPVLLLPLFYKIEPLDAPELNARMKKLAEGTGLSIEGVYRMALSQETAKANAMLAGLGRTRRVLMGDTLLDRFTPDEIEVIFAHEVGHHVHRHIPKLIAIGAIYSLAGFWLCHQVLWWWIGWKSYYAIEMPVYALPMVMFVLAAFSTLLEPIQNVLSRRFERQCDRYAITRTGFRDAYRSAFRKLARLNKDDPTPHPLEVALFHSHPPIAERLLLADE